MNQIAHDYSRHSDDELHDAIRNLDVARHPERAVGLLHEMERRLGAARQSAAVVASEVAVRTGARYREVDARERRTLFWRLFWWILLVGVPFGWLYNLGGAVVDEFLKEYYSGGPSNLRRLIDLLLSVAMSVLIGIGHWRAMIAVITNRTYGGLGVRVLRSAPRDVA